MLKNLNIAIVALLMGATTTVNAQNQDQQAQAQADTLNAMRVIAAASRGSDLSCLDIEVRNCQVYLSPCGGFGVSFNAGYNDLYCENSDGWSDHQKTFEAEAGLFYRFIHLWPVAVVGEATVYLNAPTTVEGLRNDWTLGFGGKVRIEAFPHSAVRPYVAPGLKIRNLCSFDAQTGQKWGGNPIMGGGEVGVNIPLVKIWKSYSNMGLKLHKGGQLSLDVALSCYKGSIEKEWSDAQRYVHFTETNLRLGLRYKF